MDREKLIRTLGYLLINSQTALMELQQEEKQPQQLPKPTHYTVIDGGDWIEWNDYKPWQHPYIRKHNHTKAHAIKFDNGAIFDMVNGWREFEPEKEDQDHCHGPEDTWCNVCGLGVPKSERLVPRYPADEVKDFLEAKPSTDQRVVPRALLEEIAAVMRETYDHELICNTKQFAQVLVQLNNVLATEKKDLAAPPRRETYEPHRVCSNYYATSPGSKCFNCGYSKDIHDDRDAKIGRPVHKGRTA